jgi:hypothetical protein
LVVWLFGVPRGLLLWADPESFEKQVKHEISDRVLTARNPRMGSMKSEYVLGRDLKNQR